MKKKTAKGYVIVIHSDDVTKKICRQVRRQLTKQLGVKVAVLGVATNDSVTVNQVL